MEHEKLAPGTTFGTYTIVRIIGEGGMGAVYEARHERLAKRVALKVLHSGVATSTEAVTRFMREGEAASRLRHPNVVDVTDVGVERGIPYMVMEYLEGQNLGAQIEARGQLPLSEAIDLLLPIASALATAHDEGIVHRDLKPDNIFLAKTRLGELVPKLVDFGISKLTGGVDPRLTATNTMMGTPYYMSPEQARGSKNVDGRTDQYAFGLILYEALAGQRGIRGESMLEIIHEVCSGSIVPLETLRPNLPTALTAAVARMLSRDHQARYPDMLSAGSALIPFASPRLRAIWESTFGAEWLEETTVAPEAMSASVEAVHRGPETQTPFTTPTEGASTVPPSRSRVPLAIGAAAVALVASVAVVVALASDGGGRGTAVTPIVVSAPHAPIDSQYEVHVSVTPPSATLLLDDEPGGTGTLSTRLPHNGQSHKLVARADGFVERTVTFRDAAPPSELVLERAVPSGAEPPSPAAAQPLTQRDTRAPNGRTRNATPTVTAPVAGRTAPVAVPAVQTPQPETPRARATPEETAPEARRGANRSVIIH